MATVPRPLIRSAAPEPGAVSRPTQVMTTSQPSMKTRLTGRLTGDVLAARVSWADLAHAFGCQPDSVQNLDVAGATAHVAGQGFAHRCFRGVGIAVQQVGDRDDEARRAETALHRPGLHESLLYRMQPILGRQRFHGPYLAFVRLRRQNQAGADQFTVQPDGTGAALPLLAGVLRPRQAQVLAPP